MLRRYASLLTAIMLLVWAVLPLSAAQSAGQNPNVAPQEKPAQPYPGQASPAAQSSPESATLSAYEGKIVEAIQLPGVSDRDRDHLLQLLAQKTAEPLDRNRVRDSIRTLFATGRFADIQAEVTPAGDGVSLTFST